VNLYGFVGNSGINDVDVLGMIFGWFDGWSKKGTNEDMSRRYWARKDSKASLDKLAKAVGLNAAQSEKWAIPEKPDKCGLKASDAGCCFSVPNTYIVANLLQGTAGNIFVIRAWYRLVNIGGVIGSWTTFTNGKKRYEVRTAVELISALKGSKGDLLGIVVFAHGNDTGYVGDAKGTGKGSVKDVTYTMQDNLINLVKTNGYNIKTADLMQCYSGAVNPDTGFSWRKEWDPLVEGRLRTYHGINALGIDTYL
jgi:hypothetical protein